MKINLGRPSALFGLTLLSPAPAGHLQSLRLSAWGATPAREVHFDELRVGSVKTIPGIN